MKGAVRPRWERARMDARIDAHGYASGGKTLARAYTKDKTQNAQQLQAQASYFTIYIAHNTSI